MPDQFIPCDIAREWLIECFGDQAEEIEEASDAEIKREVDRHYAGGWAAFIAQAQADHDAPVVLVACECGEANCGCSIREERAVDASIDEERRAARYDTLLFAMLNEITGGHDMGTPEELALAQARMAERFPNVPRR